MVAFLILRRRFADVRRPYRSPVGVPGALLAAVVSIGTLVILPFNDDYRDVVLGVGAFFLVGLAYFAIVGRHRLVLSPEEEFALGHGQHVARLEDEGADSPHDVYD
jgi:ethanolamine permease